MNPQVIKNAIAFLERVPINGKEAPAWCEVVSALNEMLLPPPVDTPAA